MAAPLPHGTSRLPDGGLLRITTDSISIDHANGDEVVYWDHTEWEEDPECAQAICNAITLGVREGAGACCARIQICMSCRERAEEKQYAKRTRSGSPD